METAWILAASSALALAAVLWLLHRSRAEAARLRSRLEGAAMDLQQLQLSFTRFAPNEVVERIIRSGISSSGEKREVTVLFADLVGFTPLSERLDPSVLVRILNGYFQRASRAITDHRGHVSTLIGDGILALFGAIEPNPWQSHDAVQTALALREAIAGYNRELAAEDLPPLAIGVGVHRGVGVAGLVGSPEMMAFTVVGRTINLASRVQDLTRDHDDVDILLTREVQKALDARFVLRPLPPARLRGVAEPVELFAAERFQP